VPCGGKPGALWTRFLSIASAAPASSERPDRAASAADPGCSRLWRHLAHHWPLAYETALWSVVFPLGMYSVATLAYGKVTRLAFMTTIAHVMLWVAIFAWIAVAVAGLVALAGRPGASARRAGVTGGT